MGSCTAGRNPSVFLFLPFCLLRGLQETRVATREESGVLGFPSRRGLTPRGSLECNPDCGQSFRVSWAAPGSALGPRTPSAQADQGGFQNFPQFVVIHTVKAFSRKYLAEQRPETEGSGLGRPTSGPPLASNGLRAWVGGLLMPAWPPNLGPPGRS